MNNYLIKINEIEQLIKSEKIKQNSVEKKQETLIVKKHKTTYNLQTYDELINDKFTLKYGHMYYKIKKYSIIIVFLVMIIGIIATYFTLKEIFQIFNILNDSTSFLIPLMSSIPSIIVTWNVDKKITNCNYYYKLFNNKKNSKEDIKKLINESKKMITSLENEIKNNTILTNELQNNIKKLELLKNEIFKEYNQTIETLIDNKQLTNDLQTQINEKINKNKNMILTKKYPQK